MEEVSPMGKRLGQSTATGHKGEQFVRSWATEMECVNLIPETSAPSIDGQIQLYDTKIDANLYLAFQAKCGNSHIGRFKADSKYVVLKLDAEDIVNWRKANIPVIIIWVSDDPPTKRYALWTEAARARPGANQIKISKRALLDAKAFPQLLEVARTHAGFPSIPKLCGSPLFPVNVSSIKGTSRNFYTRWQHEGSVSPIFGKVDVSLKAWRHITRRSSPQRDVCHKLSLLRFAREIVEISTKSRFLRLLDEDRKLVREHHAAQEDPPLVYSYPVKRKLRRELHAVCGLYCSRYRTDMTVEVVLEVLKIDNHIVKTKLYGVHEKRK